MGMVLLLFRRGVGEKRNLRQGCFHEDDEFMKTTSPTFLVRFKTIIATINLVTLLLLARAAMAAGAPDISPSALDQISALLNEKASWNAIQVKMDSELIHAVKSHRGQAFAPGAPH